MDLAKYFAAQGTMTLNNFPKGHEKRLLEDTSSSSSKSEVIMGIFARMFEIWGKRRSLHKRPTDQRTNGQRSDGPLHAFCVFSDKSMTEFTETGDHPSLQELLRQNSSEVVAKSK